METIPANIIQPVAKIKHADRFIEVVSESPDGDWYRGTMIRAGDRGAFQSWKHTRIARGHAVYASVCSFARADPASPALCHRLVLDFDDDGDPDHARRQAWRLLQSLGKRWGFDWHEAGVVFSGKKGVHVYLPPAMFGSAADGLRIDEWRAIVRRLGHDAGVTPDLAIYTRRAVIRLPGSAHHATRRRAIAFEAAELADLTWADLVHRSEGTLEHESCTPPAGSFSPEAAAWMDHARRELGAENKALTAKRRLAGSREPGWQTP
ncbi:MAG: hypothetical protein AAF663_09875, partial [Planctomycetota bacterium]